MCASLQLCYLRGQMLKRIRQSVIGAQTIEEDLESSDYPVLTSLGVDVPSNFQVKAILRDLLKLNKQVKSAQILTFESYNDNLMTMLQIPRSF
jgi:hypothetical protein